MIARSHGFVTWAGFLEMVKLLLKYKPPLESRNMYGGTVLGQTMWSAAHGGDPKVFADIIETLIAAGAIVPPRHVPVNKPIDDLLRRALRQQAGAKLVLVWREAESTRQVIR